MEGLGIETVFGNRKFYDIPQYADSGTERHCKKQNDKNEDIICFISSNLIGKDNSFIGPYGLRRVVYCDHIASSRALQSIESYIQEHILPNYGNVHTTTSVTSLQSSMFQQEARYN